MATISDVTGLQQCYHQQSIPHLVEKIKGFPLKAKSFRNTATCQKRWGGVLSTRSPRTTLGVWLCVYVRGFRWKDFILFQVSFKAKNKVKPTDICLKDVDWCDEEHLVCSVSYRVYSDIYNQRLHSRHLCKKPPSTQTQYVPDNEPDCSWFVDWSRSGAWNLSGF